MTTAAKLEVGQLYISVEDEIRFPDRKRKIEIVSASPDSSGRVEVLSINEGTGKSRKMKLLTSRLLGKYYRLASKKAASSSEIPTEPEENAKPLELEARWIEGQDGRPGEWMYFLGGMAVKVADKNLRRRLVAKAQKEHAA